MTDTVSTTMNLIVVRGDERVADICVDEFMRLYSRHAFSESLPKATSAGIPGTEVHNETPAR